jgi:hypothetical protein
MGNVIWLPNPFRSEALADAIAGGRRSETWRRCGPLLTSRETPTREDRRRPNLDSTWRRLGLCRIEPSG